MMRHAAARTLSSGSITFSLKQSVIANEQSIYVESHVRHTVQLRHDIGVAMIDVFAFFNPFDTELYGFVVASDENSLNIKP